MNDFGATAACLVGFIVCAGMAYAMHRNGYVTLKTGRVIERGEHPYAFWASVLAFVATSIVFLVAAIGSLPG